MVQLGHDCPLSWRGERGGRSSFQPVVHDQPKQGALSSRAVHICLAGHQRPLGASIHQQTHLVKCSSQLSGGGSSSGLVFCHRQKVIPSKWGPRSTLLSLTADSMVPPPRFGFEDRELHHEACSHQPGAPAPPSARRAPCSTWWDIRSRPWSSWHLAGVTFQEQDVAPTAVCRVSRPWTPGLPGSLHLGVVTVPLLALPLEKLQKELRWGVLLHTPLGVRVHPQPGSLSVAGCLCTWGCGLYFTNQQSSTSSHLQRGAMMFGGLGP